MNCRELCVLDEYYKARQTENGIISFLRDDFVGLCIDLYGE